MAPVWRHGIAFGAGNPEDQETESLTLAVHHVSQAAKAKASALLRGQAMAAKGVAIKPKFVRGKKAQA